MALQLQLTVRFLADRYHGNDWPPSPARLFQALVAGMKTGAARRELGQPHKRALEWLERLNPPEILAGRHQQGKEYTLFVPNNSLDSQRKSTKTSKVVRPHRLVDHTLGKPDVVYRWRFPEEPGMRERVDALDEIAARLRTLGWGVDFAMACAELSDASAPPPLLDHFVPDAAGEMQLPLPQAGFLDHLDACHEAFTHRITKAGVNPYTRPTRFGRARYHNRALAPSRRFIAFELEQPEGGPFTSRWDETQTIAAMVRHAAGVALKKESMDQAWIDTFVLGHNRPDDLGHRLSYVPLPSIGHQHSDGSVRRLLVIEPPSVAPGDREALDLLEVKLVGWILTESEDGPARAVLAPMRDRTKVLPFYTRAATVWETVTPIVLHGFNAARGQISLTKTDRLLCQAFEAAGFAERGIENFTFQIAPYWGGCGAAGTIRVPRHLAKWPRIHVRVTFKQPVKGPVWAGIGRHYGLGLLAARAGL
ncbi:MAG: type I-U CRISPR-associated protein Cas5/Cas6 [Acidobacteriia bacterium]|nr:type I-U CRISPR-associated protein Cas5/Cas6 [Terriglobia bacterium]